MVYFTFFQFLQLLLFVKGLAAKILRMFLLIVTTSIFIHSSEGQDVGDCQINTYLCKPRGLSVITTLSNITSRKADIIFTDWLRQSQLIQFLVKYFKLNFHSSKCQEECAKSESCNFTTFTNFRKIAICYILKDCEDKVMVDLYYPLVRF